MIARVADAERARGAHVVEVARAQELGAHHADQRHPAEQQHQAEQPPEARRDDAGQDDQQVERRHARPDLDEALQQQVDPAAEVALHRAGGDADDRAEDGQRRARTAPRCGSRRSAAPATSRAWSSVPSQFCQRRRRRRRRRQIADDGVVAVRDRRPDHPALVASISALHLGIACSRPRSRRSRRSRSPDRRRGPGSRSAPS